jgi:ABC-2 type transport system permease protein
MAILTLFILALSWFAATVGLIAGSPEAASGFTFLVMFLPYPSSAFVPIHTMPSWLQGFAENQPCTTVIESLRALLSGQAVGSYPMRAVLWCGGILVLAMGVSAILFQRKAR